MLELQERKRKLAGSIVIEENTPAANLTREELEFLLGDG